MLVVDLHTIKSVSVLHTIKFSFKFTTQKFRYAYHAGTVVPSILKRYMYYVNRRMDNALGAYDPRKVKDYLNSKGVECWIDTERVGKVEWVM